MVVDEVCVGVFVCYVFCAWIARNFSPIEANFGLSSFLHVKILSFRLCYKFKERNTKINLKYVIM